MDKELENRINDTASPLKIELNGEIRLTPQRDNSFIIGKTYVKSLIEITRPGVTIDGTNAKIIVDMEDCSDGDRCVFFVRSSAANVCFRNMNLEIHIHGPKECTRTFSAVYNTAFGLHLENCRIEVISDKQLNVVGVYNNGNLDTHMETRADNLVIDNCTIRAACLAEHFPTECCVYGLYNYYANSISVQNTFLYAVNRGDGERQRAAGVYTDGRFGRFVGNNIKANCTHNIGKHKEEAHAFGFINEGLYSILSANNIVGEWAGMSVGLENKGAFAKVSSNKILATHTICGRSVRNYGDKCIFDGNILTSTSRNARLFEQNGAECIVTGNLMEILMDAVECRSGCGIYAIGERVTKNIVANNILKNVIDCGIFANREAGRIENNFVLTWGVEHTTEYAGSENARLAEKLNEKNIRSIYE